jgi:hypothetical protein
MPDSLAQPPWGVPLSEERDLDALLAGRAADVPAPLRQVAEALTALQGPPSPAELRGEPIIMAEFRAFAEFGVLAREGEPLAPRTLQLPAVPADLKRPRGARHRGRSSRRRFGVLMGASAVAAVVAAVAFTGNLPGPIERLAHLSTPVPSAESSAKGKPAQPSLQARSAATAARPSSQSVQSATPSAGLGPGELCREYFAMVWRAVPGRIWWSTPVYKQLSDAAGGPERVNAYCSPYLKGSPYGIPPYLRTPSPHDVPGQGGVPYPGDAPNRLGGDYPGDF